MTIEQRLKLILFGCACMREIWSLVTDKQSREMFQETEAFADGLASKKRMREIVDWTWHRFFRASVCVNVTHTVDNALFWCIKSTATKTCDPVISVGHTSFYSNLSTKESMTDKHTSFSMIFSEK